MSNFMLVAGFLFLALPALAVETPAPEKEANPLLSDWTTPFGVPPFEKIKEEHYLPAFKEAIARQRKEVQAVAKSDAPPSFANTIEALDRSGEPLDRVSGVFFGLLSAETNDTHQTTAKDVAPLLSEMSDDILLDPALFSRVKAVWESRDRLELAPDQKTLLKKTYRDFVRGGANLDPAQQQRLRAVNSELSVLGVKFGENVLGETKAYRLVIDKREDLAGLPEGAIAAAADVAKGAKLDGKWVFTLQAPSLWPFLQYADNRELRRQILTAYITRGDHADKNDNKGILSKIAALRAEKARLLGYPTYADFVPRGEHGQEAGQGVRAPQPALDARSRGGEEGSADASGDDRRAGEGVQAGALGLALLRGEGQKRRSTISTTRRSGRTSSWTVSAQGRFDVAEQAVRGHVHRAEGHPDLPPGGADVRGEGRRTASTSGS